MKFQAELRKLMKGKGITFYGMAKAIGVDRGSLYKSLKDDSNLELNTMTKILNHLGYEIRFVESERKGVNQEKPKTIRSRRRERGKL